MTNRVQRDGTSFIATVGGGGWEIETGYHLYDWATCPFQITWVPASAWWMVTVHLFCFWFCIQHYNRLCGR